jgi:hypothetical protein
MSDDPKTPDAEPAATFAPERTPDSLDAVFAQPDVKAITPLRDQPAPSERPPTASPAMLSDELWGGPQWIHNAEGEPVFVETKAAYWDLLRRNGLHMHDQQESSAGPGAPPLPPPLPLHLTPHPAVRPLSKFEAEVLGAVTAVLRKYDLVESCWCTHCFTRGAPHGCRVVVNSRVVHLECRGGIAQWTTPVGEHNLVLQTLSNTASSRAVDRTGGTIETPVGPVSRPATLLNAEECVILRAYFRVLGARGIEPRWHHRACWSGNPWHEDDALAISVSDEQLIAVCHCRQLFARTAAPVLH